MGLLKKITISMCLALSISGTYADEISVSNNAICGQVNMLANAIMHARDSKITLNETLEIVKEQNIFHSMINVLMVEDAYQKKLSKEDFTVKWFNICEKARNL